ncbi:glycosyltransferase [Methylobacterium sp. BTF04]|uniref:rhamnosyltransferase WsaF family glycosyltransferase n=1 Tax=Methylobacterium sp. BTF04 TaxID=2708300 RepID=UPI0013D49D16|nr:rhamnan synthesis F family protein [Methylobacterium sp. BTF04]NEU13345.1 glycosyltransferase [Methylobacterium sp. BTF04]
MMGYLNFGKKRRRLAQHRDLILKSRLFDKEYYTNKYGLKNSTNAAMHYCTVGWVSGFNPSIFFDTKFYLATYTDVRDANVNPLVHYLTGGAQERRLPTPGFNVNAFCLEHPEFDFQTDNVAELCISRYGTYHWNGEQRRVDVLPSDVVEEFKSYFDKDFYRSFYADATPGDVDPYEHFIEYGQYEDRDPSATFDACLYRNKIKKRDGLESNYIYHFIRYGRKAGLETHLPHEICIDTSSSDRVFSNASLKTCVHAHCYYPELLAELIPGFSNFPSAAKIIVTVVSEADRCFAENLLQRAVLQQEWEVRLVPNRGRDLGPFIVACRDIWYDFDIVLHVHTKASPHLGWGDSWRHYLFDQTMGSKALISKIIERFASEPELGCLYPRNYFQIRRFTIRDANLAVVEAVMKSLNYSMAGTHISNYPAGSMAWYRTSTMRDLIEKFGVLDRFEEEEGQFDLTFAHALERVMPLVVQAQGFLVRSYMTPRRHPLKPIAGMPGRESSVAAVAERWPRDTPKVARHPPLPVRPLSGTYNAACLHIHWIVPSFIPGAGGHMTIFRMVEFLERFGHFQTIWLQNAVEFADQAEAKKRIQQWYRPIGNRVHLRYLPDDVRQISGDVLIASDCWTAFPAAATQNFKERFYFIQDFEPSFHPVGEMQLTANVTYDFGFAALCAGPWLDGIMRERGAWTRSWNLCADHNVYYPASETRPRKQPVRIAYYARPYTPRRAVGLGFAAFELLRERGVDFHVELFGEAELKLDFQFPYTQHGVLSPEELADLYRSCDLGVVFSTTNYSLIPLEMIACDLPVVEIDAPSTRAVFTNDEVTFAYPTPYGIADAIEGLMTDPERQARQKAAGRALVEATSWEGSARSLEAAILERLDQRGYTARQSADLPAPAIGSKVKASIVIPTFNAGGDFKDVLDIITQQACDFSYDVLVIDSSSTDGTPDLVKRYADRRVRCEQISQADFQHGRTRNLGIAQSDGDFVALLTQDARPVDTRWLSALIGGFAMGPRVAGVIGRHEAYPMHDPFTHRDMSQMFDSLALLPNVIDYETGLPSYLYPGGQAWTMLMHFYSDNNSAMSREAWKILPYPEIDWGEDQVWADEMLRLGFQKAYVNDAAVFHSHSFDVKAQTKVSRTEGAFWATQFGIDLHPDPKGALAALNARDMAYAIEKGVPAKVLKQRYAINRATVEGRVAGWQASKS